jgi:hypothetical protein
VIRIKIILERRPAHIIFLSRREGARKSFERQRFRARIIAELRQNRFPIRRSGAPLRLQKVDTVRPAFVKKVQFLSTDSNVIDFSNFTKSNDTVTSDERQSTPVRCTVFRPDNRYHEIFDFDSVPAVGTKSILEDVPRHYFLYSVTHFATKPGSSFRPIVQLHLRAPRKS